MAAEISFKSIWVADSVWETYPRRWTSNRKYPAVIHGESVGC